jgi:hypothetical protein
VRLPPLATVTAAGGHSRRATQAACLTDTGPATAERHTTHILTRRADLDAVTVTGAPVGATSTHQTVLERGTAEHSDRPHRGQASALKSKPPELGPSGPRWTRCDNRCNFPIQQDFTQEYRNTGFCPL